MTMLISVLLPEPLDPTSADDGVHQAVGLQRHPGQAVVAALPLGKFRGQRRVLDALDATDPAGQGFLALGQRAEVVAAQATPARVQGIGLGLPAATERGGGGVGAHRQRAHRHGGGGWRCSGRGVGGHDVPAGGEGWGWGWRV